MLYDREWVSTTQPQRVVKYIDHEGWHQWFEFWDSLLIYYGKGLTK